MSLRIFVIRHGETEWSLSGQHSGRADILLTENGRAEALRLGERIREVEFSNVLVSPLRRAQQTCDLAGLGMQAKTENDLAEWDNGDYEGRTTFEIGLMHPGWKLFRDGCPNGESPTQLSNRVDGLIDKLRNLDGDVAIFTHGHLARVLAARWIGLPIEFANRFQLNTASLSILCYQHHRKDQPTIQLWNSSSLEKAPGRPRQVSVKQPLNKAATQKRIAIERWENEGGELFVLQKR